MSSMALSLVLLSAAYSRVTEIAPFVQRGLQYPRDQPEGNTCPVKKKKNIDVKTLCKEELLEHWRARELWVQQYTAAKPG